MSVAFTGTQKRENAALDFWHACNEAAAREKLTAKLGIADNEYYAGVAVRRTDYAAQWEHVARYLAFGMLDMPADAFDHIEKTERERYIKGERK